MQNSKAARKVASGKAGIKQFSIKRITNRQPTRRLLTKSLSFVAIQAALLAVVPTAKAVTFNLETATIADINQAFEAEALTSEQLVQLYLNRIEAYDKQGPAINSLISINPNALAIARSLDQSRPENPGPLYGIPIILKDNFDTADLPTTGGSDVLAGSLPPDDAFTVRQLKEAGAIIIGKANMSEFALSSGRLGYSSLGGLTLNPYNLNRDASGSSSGSAAAIAANFAVLSTGSDTAGSIRGPASFNGLVGIKPTLGLTSRDGIIPLALSVDVGGPIAKTVTDAAIGLGVMAGIDPSDPATLESEGKTFDDYTQFLEVEALGGARIGIVRDFLGGNSEVDQIFENALTTIQGLGSTVVDAEFSPDVLAAANYSPLLNSIVQSEFFPQIETYLQTLDDDYPKTLEALIEASLAPELVNSETPVNPNRIAVYQDSLETGGLSNPEYIETIAQLPGLRDSISSTFASSNLDALIYPTVGCPPSPITTDDGSEIEDPTFSCNFDAIEGDPYRVGYLANLTGFPDITVPAGFTEAGLPVGLSFFAPAYSEPELLALAYAFEQATLVGHSPDNTPPLPGEVFEFELSETTAVPEPGQGTALALAGVGLLSLKLRTRWRRA
ncbi:MAG: amidase family protein [Cyanobacteria bacterium J06560_5]